MTQHPIDDLCSRILNELRKDPRGTRVASMLGAYAEEHRDWCDFQAWSEERYTRNLVHRCGNYELLLLCWNKGQISPIHDHAGQQCWMAVLEGSLEEVHFVQGEGGLEPRRRTTLGRGQVAFIQDEIAWHRIEQVGEERSVSLHLYANPIDACKIFDPGTAEATTIEMGYHSVRGQGCAGVSAEDVRAEFA